MKDKKQFNLSRGEYVIPTRWKNDWMSIESPSLIEAVYHQIYGERIQYIEFEDFEFIFYLN